jgi:hypothetical protein
MMRRVSVIDSAVALLLVKALLLTLGFARTLRILEARVRSIPSSLEPDLAALNAAAHAIISVAVVMPGRFECLEQSLALWYLLRRRGVGAELTFGMCQYPFGAHAWVTYRGEPLNEDREALRHYVAFA